jgi:hypothetical protein
MENETYIVNEAEISELFPTLKKGWCCECHEFCHMLIEPFKVKQTVGLWKGQKRIYYTGFIRTCDDHTENQVGTWTPPGVEGEDWIRVEESYFIRVDEIGHWKMKRVTKTYKKNGRKYSYPSTVVYREKTSKWVLWEPS